VRPTTRMGRTVEQLLVDYPTGRKVPPEVAFQIPN
jgi:hypothetical protein